MEFRSDPEIILLIGVNIKPIFFNVFLQKRRKDAMNDAENLHHKDIMDVIDDILHDLHRKKIDMHQRDQRRNVDFFVHLILIFRNQFF